MCGRFTSITSATDIANFFAVDEPEEQLPLSWNVAPTQKVLTLFELADTEQEKVLAAKRWGLLPPWAKDESMASKLINARSETVAEKPSFRSAIKKRRCLVPISGYYEWIVVEGQKKNQPIYFSDRENRPIVLAGIYEKWTHPQSQQLFETFSILTTAANKMIEPLHDRMPVMLEEKDWDRWLDPTLTDPSQLVDLYQSRPWDNLQYWPVTTEMNSPRFNSPECIAPIDFPLTNSADDLGQQRLL